MSLEPRHLPRSDELREARAGSVRAPAASEGLGGNLSEIVAGSSSVRGSSTLCYALAPLAVAPLRWQLEALRDSLTTSDLDAIALGAAVDAPESHSPRRPASEPLPSTSATHSSPQRLAALRGGWEQPDRPFRSGQTSHSNAAQISAALPEHHARGLAESRARVFTASVPFRKAATRTDAPFLDLWVRRFAVVTRHGMPCERRRSAVIAWAVRELTPIEAAEASVREATNKVQRVASQVLRGTTSTDGLSRVLQGIIDAPVNLGLQNYRPLLTRQFATTHPEIGAEFARRVRDDMTGSEEVGAEHVAERAAALERSCVDALRTALQEHVQELANALGVHSRMCPSSMRPMDEFLRLRFHSLCDLLVSLEVSGVEEARTRVGPPPATAPWL